MASSRRDPAEGRRRARPAPPVTRHAEEGGAVRDRARRGGPGTSRRIEGLDSRTFQEQTQGRKHHEGPGHRVQPRARRSQPALFGRPRPGRRRRRRRWRHVHDDPLGRPGQPRPAVGRGQRALPGHPLRLRLAAQPGCRGRHHQEPAGDRLVRGRHDGAAHPRRGHHLRGRLAPDRQRRGGQPRLRGQPREPEPLPGHLLPGRRHGRGRRRGTHGDHHPGRPRTLRAQRPGRPAHRLRGRHGRPSVARELHVRHRTLRPQRGRAWRPLHVHHP